MVVQMKRNEKREYCCMSDVQVVDVVIGDELRC